MVGFVIIGSFVLFMDMVYVIIDVLGFFVVFIVVMLMLCLLSLKCIWGFWWIEVIVVFV